MLNKIGAKKPCKLVGIVVGCPKLKLELTFARAFNLSKFWECSFLEFQTTDTCTFPRIPKNRRMIKHPRQSYSLIYVSIFQSIH